jgi:hypothetical protein
MLGRGRFPTFSGWSQTASLTLALLLPITWVADVQMANAKPFSISTLQDLFPMTPRTPQCEVFQALLSNSKHSGIPKDSKSPTLEVLGFTPTLGQSGVATLLALLSLALVSLTIHIMHFLLPIGMQKCPGISTRNIFQSNLHITACNSLSCMLAGICRNSHNTACNSLSCPLAGIRCMLFLKLSNVLLSGKRLWRMHGSSKGASFSSSFIGLMKVVVLRGGEIGEEVCSVGKVTRETRL